MTAEEQRIIGGLEQGMEDLRISVDSSRREQREDMRRLFERVESMSQNGCAMGQKHSARLDGIERRAVFVGALIASAVSAGIAAVLRWVRP